jgi:hypothetical protein
LLPPINEGSSHRPYGQERRRVNSRAKSASPRFILSPVGNRRANYLEGEASAGKTNRRPQRRDVIAWLKQFGEPNSEGQVTGRRIGAAFPVFLIALLMQIFAPAGASVSMARAQQADPLGGIDIADWKAGADSNLHSPVAAQGRNIYGAVTARF